MTDNDTELKNALRQIIEAEREIDRHEDADENYGITLIPSPVWAAHEQLERLIYQQHPGWDDELDGDHDE